jgi:hypothetical protein
MGDYKEIITRIIEFEFRRIEEKMKPNLYNAEAIKLMHKSVMAGSITLFEAQRFLLDGLDSIELTAEGTVDLEKLRLIAQRYLQMLRKPGEVYCSKVNDIKSLAESDYKVTDMGMIVEPELVMTAQLFLDLQHAGVPVEEADHLINSVFEVRGRLKAGEITLNEVKNEILQYYQMQGLETPHAPSELKL